MRLGTHILIDCKLCNVENNERLEELVTKLVERCELTELSRVRHEFSPQGYTVVALLSESHVSCHTWPEKSAACIDIFTCGPVLDVICVKNTIEECIGGTSNLKVEIRGGNGDELPPWPRRRWREKIYCRM
ncbi:MAG: adenosylmethionine decarboxylase [Rhodothermaceae bacterium TMED105]|jgi:S-adenosylmethionine decarboxylase proenzyme|nr:MAG: adenosylmethionine decarboxylase [Rhodothermaceae bacterium TMED105]